MKRYWLVILALPALAAACGGSDDTSALHAQVAALQTQVAPDRVVGIEVRCETWPSDGNHREYWGAVCTDTYATVLLATASDSSVAGATGGGAVAFNRRKVLTIKGPVQSYTVAVLVNTAVAIGDEWPPK